MITSAPIRKFYDLMVSKRNLSNKAIAAALANAHIETNGGKVLSENLRYSAKGLIQTFPSIYSKNPDLAKQHAMNPFVIANRVYALKLGNGDITSGDGYKYRGQGLIQLTGRTLYEQYFMWQQLDKNTSPDIIVNNLEYAAASAYWYLFVHNGDRFKNFADAGDLQACRHMVNPALLGLDLFKIQFNNYLQEIS